MGDVSLLIIVLLLVAAFLRVDFIFYIVYVVAGVYLWSRWHAPRAFRHIKFKRSFTDHAFLGEQVTVKLTLTNRSRLPLPWLQAAESVPPQLGAGRAPSYALSLRGRQTESFHYQIRPTRRGYYRLGPLHLRSGDLFGWSASGKLKLRIDKVCSLSQAAEAQRLLESRKTTGKIVLVP